MKIPTIKTIIIRIAIISAMVELAIMVVLAKLPFQLGLYIEAVLDVAILVLLSTPVIYFWIIKPYVIAHQNDRITIHHMASHDPLTHLANRRLLSEYLEKLMSNNARHLQYGALLYIDLDGLKIINDKNGHAVGDAMLIETANRLKSLIRHEDMVSRVGGDEFVVVLGQLGADQKSAEAKALLRAEGVHHSLSETISFSDKQYNIGASIGLRVLCPDENSVEELLKDADTAMYGAKKSGKGGVIIFKAQGGI